MNEKLKNLDIKLLILDVDGVLTDGKLYYLEPNFYFKKALEMKSFHVRDGIGLKMLMKNNIEIAIISGRESEATQQRMDDLGIKYVYLGIDNKIKTFNKLKAIFGIENKNIAYIGDDIPDLSVMKEVGFSIAVADAAPEIINIADHVLKKNGGCGAVREACELILSK